MTDDRKKMHDALSSIPTLMSYSVAIAAIAAAVVFIAASIAR